MTVRERMLTLRMMEKAEKNPEYTQKIGVTAAVQNTGMDQKENKHARIIGDDTILGLAVKVIGFLLPLAWGTAKVIGSVLFILAVPVLFLCLLFTDGVVLFLPLVLIGAAYGVLKGA